MNKIELAELIRNRFTPLAFLCKCEMSCPECADYLNDPGLNAQADVVARIARYIELLDS